MIKVDNMECAMKNTMGKCYRKRKNRYEAYITEKTKCLSLGEYKTESEAQEAVQKYRITRFINGCNILGLNPDDGVLFEEKYVVFPSGNILNLYGKEVIGRIDRCGYKEVILNNKQRLAHRVVAIVFLPNPDNLEQINHLDGDKLNNAVSNLEWCSRSKNLLHAYSLGLEKSKNGENHRNHKLTENDVRRIRETYIKKDKKYGATALAKEYGVDRTTILDVVNRKTWRHVE